MINGKFSYEFLVKYGIIGTNICMALLVALSLIFGKDQPSVGFYLSLIVCFLIGLFSNIAQLSFFGMINYFGGETVSRFTIGTAGSGVLVIILRAIVTAAFNSGDDASSVVPVLIYYGLSVAFNFFDLYLNIQMFKSPLYKEKINNKPVDEELRDSLISNK